MIVPRVSGRRLPAVLAAALLTATLTAAPALAGGGPGGGTGPGVNPGGGITGCSGVTCYAAVWRYITLSGNAKGAKGAAGSTGTPVVMPPPPCYMQPMFSGPQLYQLWKADRQGRVGPGQGPGFPFGGEVPQIKQHKNDTSGSWWERVTNLHVGGTCGLPLLAWVTNGAPPPLPHVPAVDLADYAYNHMRISPPRLKLNPVARSYVNLPTYVWATPPFQPPVATVTATLGNERATVTAIPSTLHLTASGGASVYDSGCTVTGSTAPDPPKNAGPGTTPDCGVVFTAPGRGNMITGSLVWTPTSGGRRFAPIHTGTTKAVAVDEIQSLNG
jgi:hypothetical protein